MEVSTTNPVLDRLLGAAGFRKDSELARLLGVSPQAVSKVRKSGKTPTSWINLVSEKFRIPKQDIAPNINPMMVEKNNIDSNEPEVDSSESRLVYERCAKLEAELEEERRERRELSTELREVNAENRRMAKENRELSVDNGVLREQIRKLSGRSVDVNCV